MNDHSTIETIEALRRDIRRLHERLEPPPRSHLLEVGSAILLSLATIASAWSAYQATRWSGLQAIRFSEANSARMESARKTDIAATRTAVDVGLFVRYAAAVSEGDRRLAEFLRERFRGELRDATDEWMKTDPLTDPEAPPSPFAMDAYALKEERESRDLLRRAEEKFAAAKEANQTGDNYVLLTVLFASVLFFSGVATKFQSFRIKAAMLLLGGVIFLAALFFLLTFPVH